MTRHQCGCQMHSWALQEGLGMVAGSDNCKRLMGQVRSSLFATEGQAAGAAWAAERGMLDC